MSQTVELDAEIPADLLDRAMALSHAGKRKLAGLLAKATEETPDDPELVRKEVNELIKDRLEGYLSGKYKTVDWRESLERMRAQLKAEFPS